MGRGRNEEGKEEYGERREVKEGGREGGRKKGNGTKGEEEGR